MNAPDDDASRCFRELMELLETHPTSAPADTARKTRAFLQCFVQLPRTEQDTIRSLVTSPEARMLASFAVALAEHALEHSDAEWLLWSVIAHDVEQFRNDPRDNLRSLAVSAYAAEQLGADAAQVFERAATRMSPRSAAYVRGFAQRPGPPPTLQSMGVTALRRGRGVRFQV